MTSSKLKHLIRKFTSRTNATVIVEKLENLFTEMKNHLMIFTFQHFRKFVGRNLSATLLY